VAMQVPANARRTLTCDDCLNYIGSMYDQVKWHLDRALGAKKVDISDEEKQKLESMKMASNHKGNTIFYCRNLCGAKYCSKECSIKAWDDHHWALCPSQESEVASEWLEMFYDHAKRTNQIFILAAKTVIKVLKEASRLVSLGVEEDDALLKAWEPFLHGQKAIWWECVCTPYDVTDEKQFRQGDPLLY